MPEVEAESPYYKLCLDLCKQHGWWATYWAIKEDGYDPEVDWKKLYEKWREGTFADGCRMPRTGEGIKPFMPDLKTAAEIIERLADVTHEMTEREAKFVTDMAEKFEDEATQFVSRPQFEWLVALEMKYL